MKKFIAIAAVLVSAQATAFWGWNDGSQHLFGNGYNNGYFDGVGNADGEADFSFDFSMSARMRTEGRGAGYGQGYGHGNGYGYNSHIPYYAAPYGFLPPPVQPQQAVE